MKKVRMQFPGFCGESVCNYHIDADGGFLVVEQLSDTTTSITNQIEDIVAEIAKREHIALSDFKVFEYYPTATLGHQYIYEIAQVRINAEGRPDWSRPAEADIALIKEQVSPG